VKYELNSDSYVWRGFPLFCLTHRVHRTAKRGLQSFSVCCFSQEHTNTLYSGSLLLLLLEQMKTKKSEVWTGGLLSSLLIT